MLLVLVQRRVTRLDQVTVRRRRRIGTGIWNLMVVRRRRREMRSKASCVIVELALITNVR
jgi:hypothetical protein